MPESRPHFLDLRRIRLPVGAWVSILHRASGAALALALPGLLYLWMLSLRSPADYAAVAAWLAGGPGRLLWLGAAWAVLHHLLAGLRHLGLDLGLGGGRARARLTARLVLIAALGLTGLAAVAGLA